MGRCCRNSHSLIQNVRPISVHYGQLYCIPGDGLHTWGGSSFCMMYLQNDSNTQLLNYNTNKVSVKWFLWCMHMQGVLDDHFPGSSNVKGWLMPDFVHLDHTQWPLRLGGRTLTSLLTGIVWDGDIYSTIVSAYELVFNNRRVLGQTPSFTS